MIHASSRFYITKISLNSLYQLMVNHVWVSIYKLQTCKLTNPDEKNGFQIWRQICVPCVSGVQIDSFRIQARSHKLSST